MDVVAQEAAARPGYEFELDANLRHVVLRDLSEHPAARRVIEQIADDELATVLLPELAVEVPAPGIELPSCLGRIVGDDGAVVLVALLPGEIDVVVECDRVAGEAVLDDLGDGLPVDALGHSAAQRLVG